MDLQEAVEQARVDFRSRTAALNEIAARKPQNIVEEVIQLQDFNNEYKRVFGEKEGA